MGNFFAISNWDEGWAKGYYTQDIKRPMLKNIPVYPTKTKGGSEKRRTKKIREKARTNAKIRARAKTRARARARQR